MQDLGSKGARGWVGAVGVPSDAVADDADDPAPVDPVVDELGVVAPVDGAPPFDAGAATEKFVPVTTVTSAPSAVGPLPMVTAPDSDCMTRSAAARWLGEE